MPYVKVDGTNVEQWADLEAKLFPDAGVQEHLASCREALRDERQAAFLYIDEAGRAVGHVNVSIRSDYVEGADSSPVGFLEAVYVEPEFRGQGIGKGLVRKAEEWVQQRGCTEMGSDAELSNVDSHRFHEHVGYAEVNRVVAFLKKF